VQAFAGNDDAHTFEYYFDQILFRGLYPFLPNTILEDMRVYQQQGIETHLSLQVAGPELAPEFNMLVFARGLWDESFTPEEACRQLAAGISPQQHAAWERYLTRRAAIFQQAMRMCDYPLSIYLDYRWLPENRLPLGEEMAGNYAEGADALEHEAQLLLESVTESSPARERELAGKEALRARFEAAELRVMAAQQRAANALARYFNSSDAQVLREALSSLESAQALLRESRERAVAFGLQQDCWYFGNINGWLTKEFREKAEKFAAVLPAI
jgi:hypothetical protein